MFAAAAAKLFTNVPTKLVKDAQSCIIFVEASLWNKNLWYVGYLKS